MSKQALRKRQRLRRAIQLLALIMCITALVSGSAITAFVMQMSPLALGSATMSSRWDLGWNWSWGLSLSLGLGLAGCVLIFSLLGGRWFAAGYAPLEAAAIW